MSEPKTDPLPLAPINQERFVGLHQKLAALQHAMQSGVSYDQTRHPESDKHLRVGVNSALVFQGALGRLLVKRGLITEAEYLGAMVEGMEEEVRHYEDALTTANGGGTKITLR